MTREKVTWPDNSWPKPKQWLDWFESCTPERRLEIAQVVCRNAELAAQCKDESHVERLIALRDDRVDQLSDHASRGIPLSSIAPQSLPSSKGKRIGRITRNRKSNRQKWRDIWGDEPL